jgi:adenine-specific DNA-methyltransferase
MLTMLEERKETFLYPAEKRIPGKFQIQNRRFLGNKFKLLNFIGDIILEECGSVTSICDIFAGTGVVGHGFNAQNMKVISNDILFSNYVSLKTFLGSCNLDIILLEKHISFLNGLTPSRDNYFSKNFGNKYFTSENAKKIGLIRQTIETMDLNVEMKAALITSLIYAVDKVANTVGHYDAFRKNIDMVRPLKLLLPEINQDSNRNNEIYHEDANLLIKHIECDVLYIDPPYNSRQYCDAYHLLENLAVWEKPPVFGIASKMDRDHLKSKYCLKSAAEFFSKLISEAKCKHILVSYNNTGESKDCRSNSRINDSEIVKIMRNKGKVKVYERDYKPFTTGKSISDSHTERVFYCKVK